MTYLLTNPITIVDYDPRWPRWFEEEKQRLLAALAPRVICIEHIGSTAVPGLAAKPILDISAALADREEIEPYKEALQALGYSELPINPIAQRRLFCKGAYNEGSHHLHVTTYGTSIWADPLLFRDYLRAHPARATIYMQVKRQAAAQHQRDLNGYHDQKSELISVLMEEARSWQATRANLI